MSSDRSNGSKSPWRAAPKLSKLCLGIEFPGPSKNSFVSNPRDTCPHFNCCSFVTCALEDSALQLSVALIATSRFIPHGPLEAGLSAGMKVVFLLLGNNRIESQRPVRRAAKQWIWHRRVGHEAIHRHSGFADKPSHGFSGRPAWRRCAPKLFSWSG